MTTTLSARPVGVRETNAATVLDVIRQAGPLSRAAIERRVALSPPTVSRQVAALIELGIVREVPELTHSGAIGRPRVPVDIDETALAACGVHIGVSTTTFGLADLRGRLLADEHLPTPGGGPEDVLDFLASRLAVFLRRRPQRSVVGIGLVTGGRVDPDRGVVDHDRLGWYRVPARELLSAATGHPVHVDGHLPAMAAAELLFGLRQTPRSLLYCYARQVVGVALVSGGRLHRGPGRGSDIAHLPVGTDVPCPCGRTGCLEVSVSEQTVLAEAVADGVIARPDIRLLHAAAAAGDPGAARILTARARALGRAIAAVRDVVDPDLVVLGGQAITDAPQQLDELRHSFADHTALPGAPPPQVTRFGSDVQAVAACTSVLAHLYDRPFALFTAARRKS
ncbi:ROK family transcriptional regulator [Saccharopolyspora hirsuta]|uniref:ROK family transcriptional regulator n=1 Tax=Saccharopolyspora hirsuta TaxID=1837 RepID=UPI001FE8700E|nr:ROK family transcriptional regulator [Saccharopolyspora hirsuta]